MKSTKVVNIYPTMPITGVNPPIRSTVKHVTKSISEIRTCLMSRAVVEEVLSDGSTIRLNIGNYDKCLDVNHTCGCGCCTCDKTDEAPVNTDVKSDWEKAYEFALEGVDLASMSRKQRRAAMASARAAADAATGKVTVETVEEEVEETVETVEETPVVEETVEEEVVKTDDVETLEATTETVEEPEAE